MSFRTIAHGVIELTVILCICLLLIWGVVPDILLGLDCLFTHYDHKVAILSSDVECRVPIEGTEANTIRLPKGLMIYAPCRHDFGRMSLDENCTYKIYLKLDAKTVKTLLKDTEVSYVEKKREMRTCGRLNE